MLKRILPSATLVAATCAVPLTLLLALGGRPVDLTSDQHFAIVLVAAVSATAAALALFVLGAQRGDRRAVVTGGAFLAIGIACLVVVSVRAATTVLLTRRPRDLAVLIGLAVLISALVAQYVFAWGEAGFWMGHAMEVLGIGLVGFPVALDARTAVPSRPLAGDLRVVDLVAREEAFLGRGVHALLRRLEEKDRATDGHTRRVAMLAVQVGEELDLPATRLRRLALGGILHDIGKLRVPDGILKKPGPLTDDEFRVIRRHPDWGAALLAELGFAPEVRAIVRDHHERLDGSGYPQGLLADQLSLLRKETGTSFSPECVAALERVLERDAALESQRAVAPAPLLV